MAAARPFSCFVQGIMSAIPHVLVLGAGPAGLGAAYRLRRAGRATVTVIERGARVGGNAGSFEHRGLHLDFGSHRLHPDCAPEIRADIDALLGDDLLDRPRHGRILLRGRWVHFPLKPFDLLFNVDPGFLGGALLDAARRTVLRPSSDGDSFASVLRARLGPTICDSFYFPYAEKIWGLPPDELAAEQAHRRVSANSPGRLVRKVLGQVPGFRAPGAGRFFYPRRGYGQISEAYAGAAVEHGTDLRLETTATELHAPPSPDGSWRLLAEHGGATETFEADLVWSTIPLTLLGRMTRPAPPASVMEAAAALDYRAMMLVYVELPVDRFSDYDAHYFPGRGLTMTRMSEPKNYSGATKPEGRTVLCAEIPCQVQDRVWMLSDDELGERVAADLDAAGIPLPVRPDAVFVRRLSHAYPIYRRGFAEPFRQLDAWADRQERLLTFGRQGLFAHDNTHHALAMAYAAVECLTPTGFDRERWAGYRQEFEKHVVVD